MATLAAPLRDLAVPPSEDRPTQPAIDIAGCSKHFPEQRGWRGILSRSRPVAALSDVSLRVAPGEFFGILGPNGAGKTTLFKILATLVAPDSGTIRVAGVDTQADGRGVRRLVASVIADERSLWWRLSARENLRLWAALYSVPVSETGARIDRALETVGLSDAGAKIVATFSSGMKQRLLIARALLVEPAVLLLDEPTRSLDPIAARDLRRLLREEIAGIRCTVLLATHSAEEALELCDRVAILDRGHVIATGEPGALIRSVAEDRYALTLESGARAPAEVLRAAGVRDAMSVVSEPHGWWRAEVVIPGGSDAVARVVEALTAGGARIGGVERVRLSLADLIERVLDRAKHGGAR